MHTLHALLAVDLLQQSLMQRYKAFVISIWMPYFLFNIKCVAPSTLGDVAAWDADGVWVAMCAHGRKEPFIHVHMR